MNSMKAIFNGRFVRFVSLSAIPQIRVNRNRSRGENRIADSSARKRGLGWEVTLLIFYYCVELLIIVIDHVFGVSGNFGRTTRKEMLQETRQIQLRFRDCQQNTFILRE